MYKKIKRCRICSNPHLLPLLDLGKQALTGVFPESRKTRITKGPLQLVKCVPSKGKDVCGLVQLLHSYSSDEMYGTNYGYRSGLNASMVKHLQGIVSGVLSRVKFEPEDLVVDIGSNDSTLLQSYPASHKLNLTGIDPTGKKFSSYYPSHIKLIPDFFSSKAIQQKHPNQKAKVITSIAMFYDLEDPIEFVNQIREVLHPEGIWVFEQSYLPSMLKTNSYDTICHEHIEYYGLKQIEWIADKTGLKIIDVSLNDANGGSFRVTAAHKSSSYKINRRKINLLLKEEHKIDRLAVYSRFAKKVEKQRKDLRKLLDKLNKQHKKVFGYGASTKGNVILQYCKLTAKDIPFIAEINKDKFGSFTPATYIPIVSESEAKAKKPDYLLVLPWHFRKGIVEREKEFLKKGGKLIFPLPEIEIVGD